MIVIGVDPDSNKHGIAIYNNGELVSLQELDLIGVMKLINTFNGDDLLFSIENVMLNKFVYRRNNDGNKAQTSVIAMSVGRCQQSQVELQRQLDHIGIKYALHPPQRNNWAKDKPLFERVTKWASRSNVDTRSAAYFGYLEASK